MTTDLEERIQELHEKRNKLDDKLYLDRRPPVRDYNNDEKFSSRLGSRLSSGDSSFGRRSIDEKNSRREEGGRKRDDVFKRNRPDYLDEDDGPEEDAKRPKRTLQSTVVMPTLDTKGREEKIERIKASENSQQKTRNNRMFSKLLLGTLNTFKQTDRKTIQQKKQEEVEKKLEDEKKNLVQKRREEKQKILDERRNIEVELKKLTREKALKSYAETRIAQLRTFGNFIQTEAEPKIFYQPAKHTIRTTELLSLSQKRFEAMVKDREEQLERELAGRPEDDHSDDEKKEEIDDGEKPDGEEEKEDEVVITNAGKSAKDDAEEEDEEDNEEVHVKLEL